MYAIKKKTRRCITLVEMMIVITIIGTLLAVLAYNYSGSLEYSRQKNTEIIIDKVQNALEIEAARNPAIMQNISSEWKAVLEKSPLIPNPEKFAIDAWGEELQVELDRTTSPPSIKVRSARLEASKEQ